MSKKDAAQWDKSPVISLLPGDNFDIHTFDASSTPGWTAGKKAGKAFTSQRAKLLGELQERFFANAKYNDDRKILLVVQGLDTAGKGGIARHVLGAVDPQGVHLASFGVPTEEEKEHHFLWRIEKQLPESGKIGLFDRSHYEDVLVQRVENIVPQEVWEQRYDEINSFEKRLVDDGFTLIKVALMVSHQEQGERLAERLARPDKWWKYNPNDIDTRNKWDDYLDAYNDVFRRTSTDYAPWYVVPADRKWFSRLAVTELLVQALIDLNQEWPKPRWKQETQIRRLFETFSAEELANIPDLVSELQSKTDEVEESIEEFHEAVEAADFSEEEAAYSSNSASSDTGNKPQKHKGEPPSAKKTEKTASKTSEKKRKSPQKKHTEKSKKKNKK